MKTGSQIKSLFMALLLSATAYGQHEHHAPASDSVLKKDSTHKSGGEMNMSMSHAFSRNLPMTRNGSGTSWQPDNTPMYAYMYHSKKWMYMVHGDVFLRYNSQDIFNAGSRGDRKFDAPNMAMLMGQRNVGKRGLFHFSTMFSLDPITVGGEGYPLLFQTGESFQGKPLVDRQHPHDLISELSVSYAHALSPRSDLFLYLGYPGEPALGPTAYVHRPSGFFNPDAPLSHHWVDATHITFGVATLGYRYQNLKLEASSFTGREPNENRYNFDKPRFDSWSGRVTYNPTAALSMQVSQGFIKQPELLHPGVDVNRTTASISFANSEGSSNFTALWGMNKTKKHAAEHGVLLEGSHVKGKMTYYGRYEWVQKSIEELDLDESKYGHDAVFPVHALTAGLAFEAFAAGQTRFSLGGQLSAFSADNKLNDLYGNNPWSAQIYIRLYPGRIK